MNIPGILSTTRLETYREYTWPKSSRFAFDHPIVAAVGLEGVGILLSLIVALLYVGPVGLSVPQSSIYAVFPEALMIGGGLVLGGYVVTAALVGLTRFWRDSHGPFRKLLDARAFFAATYEVLIHKYFQGGGGGCSYPSEKGSYTRLPFHSLVFFGFLSAFIATLTAAVYEHLLGVQPPYSLVSPPVLFGVAGGVAMIGGASVLIFLKERSDKSLAESRMLSLDYAFVLVLDLASITGLLTLALRGTSLFGPVVVVHMGTVVAFFVSAPYGKFIHYVYRYAALVKNQLEGMAERMAERTQ
jgi:citrate/tricarballylate utilization protein